MSNVSLVSPPVTVRRAGVWAGALPVVEVVRRGLAVGAAVVAVLGGGVVALPVGSAVGAEGRGFELVSPPDKKGNDVDVLRPVQAGPDGNAVSFTSAGSFADAVSSVSGGSYVARRSAEGWATHAIDLPQRNPASQIANPTLALSTDLTKALVFSSLALTPDAPDPLAGGNLYLQDNLTGARTFVGGSTNLLIKDDLVPFGNRLPVGASADLSHVVFATSPPLLPGAVPGIRNVYEFADGRLRLVSLLEDGTIDAGSGSIGGRARTARFVSSDGSRVFFRSSNGALYLRADGRTSIPISVSHRAGDPTTPVDARFGGASKDGNVVYFLADAPLTDDSVGGGLRGAALYRYEVDTGRLTDETENDQGVPADAGQIIEVSENGEYVYFTAYGALAPGAENTDIRKLFVAHRGEVGLVYVLPGSESEGPQQFSSSPNGRYLAFVSATRLSADDTTNPDCVGATGACVEVYLYDSVTGSIRCVSCATVDGRPRSGALGQPGDTYGGSYKPTLASDDGHVVFDTEARLVSEDTNGTRDVYEWDGQRARLVSSGRGSGESRLAEVANGGRDVFFFTAERLVGVDVDRAVDLYDARVGGGLVSQRAPSAPMAPCEGDGCQGRLSVPGGSVPLATVDFAGSGDPGSPVRRVSGAVRVSGAKSGKGSRFVVSVKVPSAGKITTSGARVSKASRRVTKAGSYRVGVVLSTRAKRQLRKAGRLKVAVRVTFMPYSGASSSSTLSVTLKA